ncbi:MAG: nucleoside monophosphate kinase [Patescibacteria group bacterium]|nr:nucleoside monophosphate kinase [Patescibacteria group bacterium]
MVRKKVKAVLFGPQGCGKGTQGNLLSDRLSVPLIGAGELFRSEISAETQLGKLVQDYVSSGTLAPDELVNAVVANQLKRLDLTRGFVLDGYPRNIEQAAYLDRLTKVNLVIYLKISDKEAVRRLSGRLQCSACKFVFHETESPPAKPGICSICGGKLYKRDDDTEDVIRRRLAAFHFMTEPMATYYRQRGVLLQVNAEQSITYVFQDIMKKIIKLGFFA